MKNRIFDWGKRYFLAVARSTLGPFTSGFMVIGLLAVAVFVVRMMLTPESESSLEVLFGHFQVALAICGLGVVVGGINYVVVKLFISYRHGESGLYFRVKDGKVEAANPQWGKDGIWVWLPPTARPHEIGFPKDVFPAWSEPIVLKIFFKGMFNPREVYEKIVAGAGCHSLDLWLQDRFLAAVVGSPVRDTFRLIRKLPMNEVGKALEGLEFSGGLENIDYVDVTPTVGVTVRFFK